MAMFALIQLFLFGSLIFQSPKDYPDLALECRVLADAKAEPVKMPSATAYVRSGDDGQRLEDRFDVFDLWRFDAIRARWKDSHGSRFSICRIPRKLPGDSGGETRTRLDYSERYAKAVLGPKDLDALDEAVYMLAPVEVSRRFAPRRSQRQNLAALWQYETTNDNAFVFAFRLRTEERTPTDWYMVSLVSSDEDAAEKMDEWLDEVGPLHGEGDDADSRSRHTKKKRTSPADEEVALLSSDYCRSVANYDDWHFTSASNIVIVDNMVGPDRKQFIASLTNGFPRMQAAYRSALPSPLAEDTHIAALRIFESRKEYLAYVGVDRKWSAALWSPQHRELAMYYPEGGSETLLRTVWHEALHQHLDYACSMIQTPPWFNEGHAELFAHTHFDMEGNMVFDLDPDAAPMIQANASSLLDYLGAMFDMDYEEFYDGTNEARILKYRLAWSMAYFLQVGAPKIRFQPFKDLRTDLMAALVRTGRRDEATRTTLTEQVRRNFATEWLAFWKRQ